MLTGQGDCLSEKKTIMVVDDDPMIRQMLHDMLGTDYRVIVAADGKEALERIESDGPPDAVVADQMMPNVTGVELLQRLSRSHPRVIRILVTASDRLEDARDAINIAKVNRFLSKPVRLVELRTMVSGALRENALEDENESLVVSLEQKNRLLSDALHAVRNHEQTLAQKLEERTRELKDAMKELAALAVRDGLTGLYNHRFFQESFSAEISRAKRHDRQVSLLFIDVDNFKNYNDVAGHPAGDELLRQLSKIVSSTSRVEDFSSRSVIGGVQSRTAEEGTPRGRDSDLVARYGGEEFVIMLPETPKSGALVRAERLREFVEAYPFALREKQPLGVVSISIGVATFPDDGATREAVLSAADTALYRAKNEGRNRVLVA